MRGSKSGGGSRRGPKGRKWGKYEFEEEYLYFKSRELSNISASKSSAEPDKVGHSKDAIQMYLTAIDPTKDKNTVYWNYRDGTFCPLVQMDQTVVLYHFDSELEILPEDGGDAEKSEFTESEEVTTEIEKSNDSLPRDNIEDEINNEENISKEQEDGNGKDEEGEDKAKEPAEDVEEKEIQEGENEGKPRKLVNQFNFCERAAQTHDQLSRIQSQQTQPPLRAIYKNMCNQWMIYDSFVKHFAENEEQILNLEKEEEEKKKAAEGEESSNAKDAKSDEIIKKASKSKKEKSSSLKNFEEKKPDLTPNINIDPEAHEKFILTKSISGLNTIERLITQNIYEDITEDFKYFEDQSDEFRENGEGTLLPLWKFSYEKAKKLPVTDISWSKSQPDMFVVSYGSISFSDEILEGLVVIYSLRNPAYTEQVWESAKGAMCCEIHPSENTLVAIGLNDGNVTVLNLKRGKVNESATVIMKNTPTDIKHSDPVCSVKWANLKNNQNQSSQQQKPSGKEDNQNQPSFFSGGMDGKIIQWSIGIQDTRSNEGLDGNEICKLILPEESNNNHNNIKQNDNGIGIEANSNKSEDFNENEDYLQGFNKNKLFGGARCIAFHPKDSTLYLIGTTEGNIFQCSSLYGSRFIKIYNAHFLPVSRIQWNYYHSEVFISCSEDWNIKIFDKRDKEALYVFEIGVPVHDVDWAPFSSTVFAVALNDGKVHIYDLNANKEKAVCIQQVVTKKKIKPLKIQFNPFYPILIVGDDRGQLTTLKLSPNLRILPKDPRGNLIEGENRVKFEINKMEKLLSLVREPENKN